MAEAAFALGCSSCTAAVLYMYRVCTGESWTLIKPISQLPNAIQTTKSPHSDKPGSQLARQHIGSDGYNHHCYLGTQAMQSQTGSQSRPISQHRDTLMSIIFIKSYRRLQPGSWPVQQRHMTATPAATAVARLVCLLLFRVAYKAAFGSRAAGEGRSWGARPPEKGPRGVFCNST